MPPTERLDATDPAAIAYAVTILRSGGLVAFPTETVYGLGADALNPTAVEKIFIAKQRPQWDPLIVHIDERWMLELTGGPGTRTAKALMDRFWPGPLTLLLPRDQGIKDIVTAGRPLVGVRMPSHPVARRLINKNGGPIAAPSANLFGHTSPTTADHVLADLDGRIDAVLDGGPTPIGVESTVASVLAEKDHVERLILYRAGSVSVEELEQVVGLGGVIRYQPEGTAKPESLPSPGVGIRHYAPRAQVVLVNPMQPREGLIEDSLVDTIKTLSGHKAILLPDGWKSYDAALIYRWGPWDNPELLAQRLYAGLRELDDRGATVIVCPVPEGVGVAEAIRDRLEKAARSS